jgi:N-acyl homoserine lactone hydrolase
VTDVILTHAHYDQAVNFTLFPNATVWIGDEELIWAASQPPGFNPLPGLQAVAAPGHTAGHLILC